ncbi:Lrp/AsnC family transcriptional regulator [Parapedobacter koreensis]|uniref:Transcriptional regulator, AsnC family n=1 Tax=Parapedobacter koreensis TaxID=332977 RepID=A0A1H7MAQ0_9SPHI|nr:Lrp/AsnC family transcriptional regulator [Parapedobacter koreensis]SEL08232.1 transcriptional regulator, AsnC family [Parapedobacter koreensis]
MEELDHIDRELLRKLQLNAKATTKELAADLGLTISPIYERIKRLEERGYIKQYVAVLDKKLLGRGVTAICQVSMRYHDETFIEQFERDIQGMNEVQECYHMGGPIDFLLKINVGSLDEYHDFVKYKLSQIHNIGTLNSGFVLKEIKHHFAYSI